MLRTVRSRWRLPLAVLALAALLGGCVAYPAYPGYGYDGAPYYPGGVVAFGGGWSGHGWHGRNW